MYFGNEKYSPLMKRITRERLTFYKVRTTTTTYLEDYLDQWFPIRFSCVPLRKRAQARVLLIAGMAIKKLDDD